MLVSKALNWLLQAVGYSQAWHISWVVLTGTNAMHHGDGVCVFSPRPVYSGMQTIREHLARTTSERLGVPVRPENVHVLSMVRIGRG